MIVRQKFLKIEIKNIKTSKSQGIYKNQQKDPAEAQQCSKGETFGMQTL